MERFVIIDLETTGHSVETDQIIEVGMVIIENGEIIEDYSTLINPNQSIPPFITSLTGITDEDVRLAPSFAEVAPKIAHLFADSYFVAHNVAFDLRFLNTKLAAVNLEKLTNPVIDTVELSRILFPQAPSFQLEQLAEYLSIEHDEAHRALADAYMTAEILLKMRQKLYALPYETIHHLQNLEPLFISDLHHWFIKRKNELAFSPTECDNIVSFGGIAFKHTDPMDEVNQMAALPFNDYLDQIYETKGTMAKHIPNYEKRTGQRQMSEMIFDAFQMHRHALIEAGTGTGKSLAYLIPAIYEALQMNERVVISTHTTQLQSQLLEEEIPLLRKLIAWPFNVALLKGKQHYLSLEKFARELSPVKQNNHYDLALTKAIILVWLTETETGDVDEIHLPPSGYYFFYNVSTEAEGSVRPSSPWFRYSFYQKARQKAQKAEIIITNHALLCTDMLNDYSLLPSYERVIMDEAHHFGDIASHHYGYTLDYVNTLYAINEIGSSIDQGFVTNMLQHDARLTHLFPIAKWDSLYDDATYELDELFRTLFQYVIEQHNGHTSLSDTGRIQYRLNEEVTNKNSWLILKEMATRLTFYLRDMIHELSLIEEYIVDEIDQNQLDQHLDSLQLVIDHLEDFFIATDHHQSHVKWIEIEAYGAKNSVYLYNEPADISKRLASDFFECKQSVILTSATLTMRNSFSFMIDQLGLHTDDLLTEQIASPFAYESQAQILIPNDFPDVQSDRFIYSTCEAIISLAEITDGRMLVLFTSYDMLRKSHSLLQETMDLDKFVLIAQGISSGSRSRLKKNFQKFERSILLGTSSFWEGIDIPGEDLSCVMIVRLPFQPPNHPVFEAKAEQLKEQGKNAFFDLSLPQAVIRFKQGFGRLIRSTRDRGIVFVCDARIKKAKYGKFFLDSIPEVPVLYDSTYELFDHANKRF